MRLQVPVHKLKKRQVGALTLEAGYAPPLQSFVPGLTQNLRQIALDPKIRTTR